MRLNEITNQTADQKLFNAGYLPIASGKAGGAGNSMIYHRKDDPFVLKLFSSDDVAYKLFLQFCSENPQNKNLPVFRGKIVNINESCCAIRMEKLEPISDDQIVSTINSAVDIALSIQEETGDTPLSRYKRNTFLQYWNQFTDELGEELMSTISKLADFLLKHDLRPDLKTENIMRRHNIIVLIDPFY